MKTKNNTHTKSTLAALVGLALATGAAHAATIIGHPLVTGSVDGQAGFVMTSDPVAGGDAGDVTEFSFYSVVTATTITPLIFDNAFEVIGVGTTRTTTTGAGIETFDFGLVTGSADIGPGKFFGWTSSGTDSSPVAFSASPGHTVSYGYNWVPVVGETPTISGTLPRTYSMQFTVEPIPEPSTTALLGLGGLALILRRRK